MSYRVVRAAVYQTFPEFSRQFVRAYNHGAPIRPVSLKVHYGTIPLLVVSKKAKFAFLSACLTHTT